jgi:DNA-binding Lrp family transcriptional regulator
MDGSAHKEIDRPALAEIAMDHTVPKKVGEFLDKLNERGFLRRIVLYSNTRAVMYPLNTT